MTRGSRQGRWWRRLVLSLVPALIGLAQVPATADPAEVDFAVACPDIPGTAAVPTNCVPLSDAISSVLAVNNGVAGPATIVLLPGEYCPFTLPFGYRRLTIQGAGYAGFSDGGTAERAAGGYEAQLSTIGNFPGCQDAGSPPQSLVTFTPQQGSDYDWYWEADHALTFRNLTLQGPGAGSGSQDGMDFAGGDLNLTDDLVTGFPGYGVHYTGGDVSSIQDGANLVGDAFTGNNVGAFVGSYSGIDDSTFTQNTVGLEPQGDDSSINDTITGNTTGVEIYGSATNAVNDTIVAGNSTDCGGTTSDWESAGSYNSHNLNGSTCRDWASGTSTDISYDGGTQPSDAIGSVQTTGITPWFSPPAQAQDAGDTCLSPDQQLDLVDDIHHCDVGSIEVDGATSTPDLQDNDGGAIDFGTVPVNQTQTEYDVISNTGGGLVGISSVATDNPDFAVANDGCSLTLAVPGSQGGSCSIQVSFSPSSQSPESGHLTLHTTAGDVVIGLTGTGSPAVSPPTAPQHVAGDPGVGKVTLTWDPPASDGGSPVTSYDVRYAPHGTANWNYYTDVPGSPQEIDYLDNGTAYDFEVAAETQWYSYASSPDASPWSDPITVTPGSPHASTLTAPANATVNEGAAPTVSTTLADAKTSAPIAGATVILLAEPAGAGSYQPQATTQTDSAGKAAFKVHPTVDTSYMFRYGGGPGHVRTSSVAFTVTVNQVVVAALTHSSVKHGKPVQVFGKVSPDETGRQVVLQRQSGRTWVKAGTATIKRQRLPNGKTATGFVLSYKPASKGTVKLRVYRAATAANGAGHSATLALSVR